MSNPASHQMSLRVPQNLEARLTDLAKRLRMKKSDLIRYALEQTLPRVEAEGVTIKPAAASVLTRSAA